jgi:hypothetical protein
VKSGGRVGHQGVDPPEALQRRMGQGTQRIAIADIALSNEDLRAQRFEFRRCQTGLVFPSAIHEHDVMVLRELARDRSAYPPAGSGDQRRASAFWLAHAHLP